MSGKVKATQEISMHRNVNNETSIYIFVIHVSQLRQFNILQGTFAGPLWKAVTLHNQLTITTNGVLKKFKWKSLFILHLVLSSTPLLFIVSVLRGCDNGTPCKMAYAIMREGLAESFQSLNSNRPTSRKSIHATSW